MRVLAAVLVLVTSLVGFIFSYEIAYRHVVNFMNAPVTQSQSIAGTTK